MLVPESFSNLQESPNSLKSHLENILKLMLLVWCRETNAIKSISGKTSDVAQTITVQKKLNEYGFRVHGCKPAIISAIESDTPAESSGMEVGDVIVSINGINVLNENHSEVVQIARRNINDITLELIHINKILNPTYINNHRYEALYNGYLWKLSGYASGRPSNKWIRRWFVLSADNCLYFYKTDYDKQPTGAIMLFGYDIETIENTDDNNNCPGKAVRFNLIKRQSPTLHLAADSHPAAIRWAEVLKTTIKNLRYQDILLENARRNLMLSPKLLEKPDSFGYLSKFSQQCNCWKRRYCVLKDAFLYFYQDINAKNAIGLAFLKGYTIEAFNKGSEKHAFRVIPTDSNQKPFHFCAESDIDQKKWVTAITHSINRWTDTEK